MSKRKPAYDYSTGPGEFSGSEFQIAELGNGRMRAIVTYPVTVGGGTIEYREVSRVLSRTERAALAMYLLGDGVAEALTRVAGIKTADLAFLHVSAVDYGPDSTPASNYRELVALRKLAEAVTTVIEGHQS